MHVELLLLRRGTSGEIDPGSVTRRTETATEIVRPVAETTRLPSPA